MTQTNSTGAEHLLDRLAQHAFIVMLHVSWPKMRYQIADAIVEIQLGDEKTKIAEDFRSNPHWTLMPDRWQATFTRIEGQARSALANASINFATRGMSVLPISRAGDVFGQLERLRAELTRERTLFCEGYARMLEELKTKLTPDIYALVARKLPTAREITDKFGLVWAIVPIGGQTNMSAEQLEVLHSNLHMLRGAVTDSSAAALLTQCIQMVDAAQAAGAIACIDDADALRRIAEARQQMGQFSEQILEEVAREPRRVLAEATKQILDAIAADRHSIRGGTLDQLRRAFELVDGFAFMADTELLANMRACRQALNQATPQDVNSLTDLGRQLADGLAGVHKAATNPQAPDLAVRKFRRIDRKAILATLAQPD